MAIGPILRANGRHLRRHPALAALTVLGIALGVAMSSGIDLAIASAHRAFADSVGTVGGAATDIIAGGSAGIPDAAVAPIRARLAPSPLAPRIECLVGAGPRGRHGLRLIGIDPVAQGPFMPRGSGLDLGGDLAQLMIDPHGALLTARTAATLGVGRGDELALRIGTRREQVRVLGLIGGHGEDTAGLDDCAWCDISTAQELTGRLGAIDELDLILDDDGRRRLAGLSLPAGASASPAAARAAALGSMTSAFDTNLSAMGLLAMLVGLFLIYNTIDFLAVQRAPDLARLRMHGAARAAVGSALLLEAAVLGACGSALGLALGIGCCQLLIDAITKTIGDLWFALDVRAIALPPGLLAANFLAGTLASVAAALPSFVRAARLAPSVSLQAAQAAAPRRASMLGLLAGGAGALLLGWIVLACGGSGLGAGFCAIALGILGYALLVPPMLALAILALARPLGRLLGPLVAIAARSARATLARTGLAVAALAVAAAASLGVDIMVGSFRGALGAWLDSTLLSDVYVSAPRQVAARMDRMPLPPDLVDRLRHVPGEAEVIAECDAHPPSSLGPIDLMAFTMPARARAAFTFVAAEPDPWRGFAQGELIVTEPFAARHRLSPGGTIDIATDRGSRRFRIAGVVRDYSSDQGAAMLAMSEYERWWDDRGIIALSAYAAPGVAPRELENRMREAAGGALLEIQSNADLRRASLEVFDRTFAITRAMRLLAGSVAFLGVLAALMAQGIERGRELALLRMHGATPGQIGAMVGSQALLCGLAAGLLALPLGTGLAELLIHVVNRRSFGWSYDLRLDAGSILGTLALALGAATLAGLYPAYRAMRSSPAAALAGR